jgi:hypothetical protein
MSGTTRTSGTSHPSPTTIRRRSRWLVPILAPIALSAMLLAACGSGAGNGDTTSASADADLAHAGTTVLAALSEYLHQVASSCPSASSPVACLESADRDLGGKVHDYANVLAVGHGFSAPESDLSAVRDQAQTLANSLEILGDAQPTQANYDQVRNTFDVNAAVAQLQKAVVTLNRALGK